MPIKFTFKKVPIDESGKAYDSLEHFQATELVKAIECLDPEAAKELIRRKSDVLEILQLTMDARPTARGVRKPRKAKASDSVLAFNLAANAAK